MLATLVLGSCESETSVDSPEKTEFNYSKTYIALDDNIVTVNTENVLSDFKSKEIFLSNNVKIQNSMITAEEFTSIWFIPFNKDENPYLLRGPADPDPSVEITCECPNGGLNVCDVHETPLGDGRSKFSCVGMCVDLEDPRFSTGACTMGVIIGKASINGVSFSTGMIVASKEIIFNGRNYLAN